MTRIGTESSEIAVVGGGLAGLSAALRLARAGRRVALFEKAHAVGGRARGRTERGITFNLGPHALYAGGAGAAVLRELGVPFSGGVPSASGGFAIGGGVLHTLPGGLLSLLATGLLALPAKLETARLLAALPRLDLTPLAGRSLRDWLAGAVRHREARALVQALCRLATYADDAGRQSAGAALAQLQLALARGVYYLDGGWQTLVDGLHAAAAAAGVALHEGTRVAAVEHDDAVRALRLADGSRRPVAAAVLATGPAEALEMLEHGARTPLAAAAAAALPVRAACLDVSLARLPRPRALFALGIDRPLYFSVHSARARLAPPGTAVIHVAKYLGSSEAAPAADERELEGVLDLVQPGWRPLLLERRFLPRMVVSHALATAAAGGTAGRPGPEAAGIRGLLVAGDWVGPVGLLADASLASGGEAARLLLAEPGVPAARACA
jgi:phytoene dehydrogenase-like protein